MTFQPLINVGHLPLKIMSRKTTTALSLTLTGKVSKGAGIVGKHFLVNMFADNARIKQF